MNPDAVDCTGPFAADGPLAEALPAYAPRPAQQALAGRIGQAIVEGRDLVAEAGTGTGKTLAYLVPALQSAMAEGHRVVFSTGTRTLQDQLYFRDLPLVCRALSFSGSVALLKGRSNYLCLHRLDQSRADGRLGNAALVSDLERVHEWSAATADGDLSTADLLDEDSPLWPRVTSTVDNCLGGECEFYEQCHVVQARRRAQDADAVVVNHHLLLADMALKDAGFGEVLPDARVLVLDEAHLVPDIATRFFSLTLSSRQLRDLLRDARREAAALSGVLASLRDRIGQANQQLQVLGAVFHEQLPARGSWPQLAANPMVLDAVGGLMDSLTALDRDIRALGDGSSGLDNVSKRLQAAAAAWRRMSEPPLDEANLQEADWQEHGEAVAEAEQVVWFEQRQRGFVLHLTPLDVAANLARERARNPSTWVLTSATLTVRGDFSHFTRPLGLDGADTFLADGVFDYQQNARLWLPAGLPEPRSPDYTRRLMAEVLPLLEANRGRAFLLFTSYRALNDAAAWLAERTRLPLFVQGQGSRTRLLQDFRESGNGLLLGAASFWEGVDVAGPALSMVVIDKLPFAAPDDPVLEARIKALRRRGDNPFRSLQLPQAVIALKQGAGRLIRQTSDCGVLVLGDPRLDHSNYGRVFLESLPPMPRVASAGEVTRFISERVNAENSQSTAPGADTMAP